MNNIKEYYRSKETLYRAKPNTLHTCYCLLLLSTIEHFTLACAYYKKKERKHELTPEADEGSLYQPLC